MTRLFTLIVAALLAGCATPPAPLPASSPANAAAPEGARVPRQTSLCPDAATRKTAALLSAAQKEPEHGDVDSPASSNAGDAPKTK